MTAELERANLNVRVKIAALWTSMLFVFAYVDIFSLYRPDVRADLDAGEISGFTVNQAFLVGTTIYVVIPSLMIFGALILRPRLDRLANIVLGTIYALTASWARSASGASTSSAAPSKSRCSPPSCTTPGPGRGPAPAGAERRLLSIGEAGRPQPARHSI